MSRKLFDLGSLAEVNLTGNDDDPWQQKAIRVMNQYALRVLFGVSSIIPGRAPNYWYVPCGQVFAETDSAGNQSPFPG